MIPGRPGHSSRDSGTEKPDRRNVGLGLQERSVAVTPARWLTTAGLAWTAAVVATIVSLGTATLAAIGRDVALLLAPQSLAFAWMGAVLLARRPGHPMGPLLCLIGLTDAICQLPFAYARYTVVHAPGSLPGGTAALWATTWVFAPATSLIGLVLPLVFPEGRLLSPRWRPALWAALAFIPLSVAATPSSRRPWAASFATCPTRTPSPDTTLCSRYFRTWPWRAGSPPPLRRRRA